MFNRCKTLDNYSLSYRLTVYVIIIVVDLPLDSYSQKMDARKKRNPLSA